MGTATQSIRDLIATQATAAAVLHKFDIDLCSHADVTVAQACAEQQLSVDQVTEKLAEAHAREQKDVPAEVSSHSPGRLIQHIVRTHHQYVRQELPRLAESAHRVAETHAERVPELRTVAELLDQLRDDMFMHLEKEEQILFPHIAQIDEPAKIYASPCASFRSIAQPVAVMMREHDSAEALVAYLRNLTQSFKAPEWACPTYVALMTGLDAFDRDLRQHVHLEEDLLFPRAIELEAQREQPR